MTQISRVKGMQDVLPEDRRYWDAIIQKANDLAHRYGFRRVDVPIIEYTDLFSRGAGTASDFFVQKEMYTINEEDGSSLTLRPEFTAGLVRAYLENGMANWPRPVKIYSIGPLFRRERPQAGRYRQHSQFNPEILGEMDPAADLEIMMLAMSLHQELGYKKLTFQLNSTGCPRCKPNYVDALEGFLSGYIDELSEVDRERLRRNPLRVLDSKEKGIDAVLRTAPKILDYLCDECDEHFSELRSLLESVNEPYTINQRLVRGIDYYTKTVFELWDVSIGAQSALVGGGRYDGLAEAIGGPPTPGVGVGIGIERIAIGLKKQSIDLPPYPEPSVLVAHFGGETKTAAVNLTFALRKAGFGTRLTFAEGSRSLKSQMREANRHQAELVFILGEEELQSGTVTIRKMDGGSQSTVDTDHVMSWLSEMLLGKDR